MRSTSFARPEAEPSRSIRKKFALNTGAPPRIGAVETMKLSHLVRSVVALPFALHLAACAATSASSEGSAATPAEISQREAVSRARSDAAARFQTLAVASTVAQQAGSYWVVELRDPSGAGVHYAISRQDGSIRERRSFQ
jgi:hypothetical protein